MESNLRHTPETIQVYPLDMEKLNKDINQFFHKDSKFPANITYRAHGAQALMREPKLCIIDDEFIGHDLEGKIIFYVYEEESMSGGRKRCGCFPTQEIILKLKEAINGLPTE